MPYIIAKDEFARAAGGTDKLVQLTDLEGDGDIAKQDAVIARAQLLAEAWIHSYIQRRYAVPFVTLPDVVRQLVVDETVYQLIKARGMLTENERLEHDGREHWLENVAKGLVSPGIEPDALQSSHVAPAILPRDDRENISRLSLEKW